MGVRLASQVAVAHGAAIAGAHGLTELDQAAAEIGEYLTPTAQINWPLLSSRCGCELWVKHENHNPTGAFKVRGGLLYVGRLVQRNPDIKGLITATRGNHGQSIAFAAARHGLQSVVVVPEGNNPEKNLAMQALGAELVIYGKDFDEAVPHAQKLALERGLHRIPSFHPDLVTGVASYAMEFLRARPTLQRVYIPIGLGSGICGMITARNALQHQAEIVGVVSTEATCYAQSFSAARCISTESANTLADGMAVRVPNAQALQLMLDNVARIVTVDDQQILEAIGHYFSDTHNIAEGAGAAALAALLHEGVEHPSDEIGVVLSGGNADRSIYQRVLAQ